MATYALTGKLGAGKTLVAIHKIREALRKGLPIATNIDLNLDKLVGVDKKHTQVYRIKDRPDIADLDAIGYSYSEDEPYNESKFGLLVFDECGTWFNSRSWNDKNRQLLIDALLHIRKKRWHVYFIIQDINLIDKQAREALIEHVVYMRRSDRLNIPFIGRLSSLLTGYRLTMPKMHYGIVKYGIYQHSLTVDTWVFSGVDLYRCYDTEQVISHNYESEIYSVLPPWYVIGRYRATRNLRFYMRLSKIYFRQFSQVAVLVLGLSVGVVASIGAMFSYFDAKLIEHKKDLIESIQPAEDSANDSELEDVPEHAPVKQVAAIDLDFIDGFFRQYRPRLEGASFFGPRMMGSVAFYKGRSIQERLTMKQLISYGWAVSLKNKILTVTNDDKEYIVTDWPISMRVITKTVVQNSGS